MGRFSASAYSNLYPPKKRTSCTAYSRRGHTGQQSDWAGDCNTTTDRDTTNHRHGTNNRRSQDPLFDVTAQRGLESGAPDWWCRQ